MQIEEHQGGSQEPPGSMESWGSDPCSLSLKNSLLWVFLPAESPVLCRAVPAVIPLVLSCDSVTSAFNFHMLGEEVGPALQPAEGPWVQYLETEVRCHLHLGSWHRIMQIPYFDLLWVHILGKIIRNSVSVIIFQRVTLLRKSNATIGNKFALIYLVSMLPSFSNTWNYPNKPHLWDLQSFRFSF
jgi:hypothetical protein